jgi:hypothetical protein
MKLEFLERFSENSKYQVSSKSAKWAPSCFTRTDGHDVANSRFSQFCERASNYGVLISYNDNFGSSILNSDKLVKSLIGQHKNTQNDELKREALFQYR